jgi:hypothetical protein
MSGHTTHQPHGSGIRGFTVAAIDSNEGRFGRLFSLKKAEFSENALAELADKMRGGDDPPKDGADKEESHIPAAYTYLGQFVDHDLTFDPSTFQQQKHDPDGIVDFRTPRFDLDNLYGRGPGDQPYLYDGIKLLLGDKLQIIERNPTARDLPRAGTNSLGIRRAIIGDPRNDENVIVSQMHGAFLRFHNHAVDRLKASFEDVQREVRWHYQWLVLHDFLPRIVEGRVLAEISEAISNTQLNFRTHPPKLKFFDPSSQRYPFMPVEFSVAAYRLGHSMVRPGYRLSEVTGPLAIFDQNNPTNGLNAFGEFPRSWAIDWQRFIDLGLRQGSETKTDRVQLAYKLDTSLVEPLSKLPRSIAGDEAAKEPRLFSLAFRNLLRGVKLGLPSGQAVARHMELDVIPDEEILIGTAETGSKETDGAARIVDVDPSFRDSAPLWTYVLAEARRNFYRGPEKKAQLGPVGGRIVAEVFVGLMLADDRSYLKQKPDWTPTLGSHNKFTLADLLRAAVAV